MHIIVMKVKGQTPTEALTDNTRETAAAYAASLSWQTDTQVNPADVKISYPNRKRTK